MTTVNQAATWPARWWAELRACRKAEHAAYLQYIRELDFRSAVPEPPHTAAGVLVGYTYDALRRWSALLLVLYLLPPWHVPLSVEFLFVVLVAATLMDLGLARQKQVAIVVLHLALFVSAPLRGVQHAGSIVSGSVVAALTLSLLPQCTLDVPAIWPCFPQWLMCSWPTVLAYAWLRIGYLFASRVTVVTWAVHFLVSAFVVLNSLLSVADALVRRSRVAYHNSLTHPSVPHVRPMRYAAEDIDAWHLRCEDGRQRWYNGTVPGLTPTTEEGNELAKAQMRGYATIDAFRSGEKAGEAMEVRGEVAARKAAQRRWLERYLLGAQSEPSTAQPRSDPAQAMDDGLAFLTRLQDPLSGHWPNDYSGCLFLTPGAVFAQFIIARGVVEDMFVPTWYPASTESTEVNKDWAAPPMATDAASCVAGRTSAGPEEDEDRAATLKEGAASIRRELVRYIRNYQNEDGGWGQHTEGHSIMLGTVLNYVALRLLGVPAADEQVTRARAWIHAHGGAVYTPMWGKLWLCVLGLFSWEGMDPLPPELVLLPDWFPFSVGRMWCHSRVLAIPFSYLYGARWLAPSHPTLESLKEELYVEPFGQLRWAAWRGEVCRDDLYTPTSCVYRAAMSLFRLYEEHHPMWLRRRAMQVCWRHIAYDDENTHFICLGPVNKSIDMLITWIREGRYSPRLRHHQAALSDYLFMTPWGMNMNSYNGSQLWDTAFAVQAMCACRGANTHHEARALAQHYVDIAQVRDDPPAADLFYRHRTRGAWNFSTRAQAWQVSDCTAEGARALILLLPYHAFPSARLYDAVDEILSLRNADGDGGWCSYEPRRGPPYCELMNSAELFKDIMVEYSYAECTSSCVHTLSLFRRRFPDYRRDEVDKAIAMGVRCVLKLQKADGSFYGSWGVCYTYAAWLVAGALHACEEIACLEQHPACMRLVDFLLEHVEEDGGWGESVNACARERYVRSENGSQVVQTAWAVMAIMHVTGRKHPFDTARNLRVLKAVRGGVGLIMSRQTASGDWPQERNSGIFNGTTSLNYGGYKNVMPVWALGLYHTWKDEYATLPDRRK